MKLSNRIAVEVLAAALMAATFASAAFAMAGPTVAEIVEKNAAARGGVDAWHKLQSMAWTGYAEGGTAPGRKLPFLLEQQRPGSTRFEIISDGQKSIRIYDGKSGWKVRPGSGGIPQVLAYSDDELRFARGAQVIDGPLMNYAAQGASLAMEGVGDVDGRKAYILDIKLPSGGVHRVWVDTETFLEVRHEREVRDANGRTATVTVHYRDYRVFEGLQMPVIIETGAAEGRPMNKLVIERVALNPPLDEKMFAKPDLPAARRNGVVIDTRNAEPGQPRSARQR